MVKNAHIVNNVGKDINGINKQNVVLLLDTNALKILNGTVMLVSASKNITALMENVLNVKRVLILMELVVQKYRKKTKIYNALELIVF